LVEVSKLGSVAVAILLVIVSLGCLASEGHSRQRQFPMEPVPSRPVLPLVQVLNSDGSINRSARSGSTFDARGWTLVTGALGEPKFVPRANPPSSVSAEPGGQWDDQFTTPGADGALFCVAVQGNVVVVGGAFSVVDDVIANNVARWDGTHWSSLGTGEQNGVSGPVEVLAFLDESVYVGGRFISAGGRLAHGLACWDGATWIDFGDPLQREGGRGVTVNAIAFDGGGVWVGGQFDSAAGLPARNIARLGLDTDEWSSPNGGVSYGNPDASASVSAIAIDGTQLYAGGRFDLAGDGSASNVAAWDLLSLAWSPLGAGTDDLVSALVLDDGFLYAGGSFTRAGGKRANSVARWDGAKWRKLGKGLPTLNGLQNLAEALVTFDSRVVAVGSFPIRARGTITFYPLVEWTGKKWVPFTDSVTEPVQGRTVGARNAAVAGRAIYIVGDFTRAGPMEALQIARWHEDVGSYAALQTPAPHNGISFGSAAFAPDSGGFVIAALPGFTAGGIQIEGIGRFDGAAWTSLDTGSVEGVVATVLVAGSDIYIGGSFSRVGGVAARNVARWNGTSWSALDDGVTGPSQPVVSALAFRNGMLFAGGRFAQAGDVAANNIAVWDGARWSALGDEITNGVAGDSPLVTSLAFVDDSIFVAGTFTEAGGAAAHGVARWDGQIWSPLGDGAAEGVDGEVYALTTDGDDLFVGGAFSTAGAVPAASIARWSQGEWSGLEAGLTRSDGDLPSVFALAVSQGVLYVGGRFDGASGQPVANVVTWDGAVWSTLAGGLSDSVQAILPVSDGIIFIGAFSIAGGDTPSVKIARWHLGPSQNRNASVSSGPSLQRAEERDTRIDAKPSDSLNPSRQELRPLPYDPG
jgi:hypothetical protein